MQLISRIFNKTCQPNLMNMVNNWLNIIQDYLLPPTCILCGSPGFDSQDLCKPCFHDLHKNRDCCYRCADIFESRINRPQLCGKCLSSPPSFDETHAPYLYQSTIRYLITTLKFNRQYKNARLLGYLLADALKNTTEMPEVIIPVPLHPKRLRERGFNQSMEIAKTLSNCLNLPINAHCCQRLRNTAHQIDLPAKQRHKNVRNAFILRQPIKEKHIAIVDDVMTTGTTVNELAKILKKAGVARVDIWVCARA